MKKCRGATRLMSDALERPLTAAEKMALRTHLLMCGSCRNFSRQVVALRDFARHFSRQPDAAGDTASKADGED
ncbi:zf-HC2 domain-containing protein [Pseudomaricurvus sp. HS19]|uniref:zf-HC2 domain-containing protein n=1 Tax=Pseudomaricurvus sp. HS19 TaxID=2692626 RepID=UPI001368DAA7|nr:zf-HC2 domain-containing protein [Pseudomaricurvus sp. HS19]MYM64454.1 zf-HC2 domain-containing protein [Pseudomaricurvus sp. HS19]